VRALGVVVPPPAFDDDLGLAQAVEDLAIQELVPELGVEAFAVAVLPGAAGLDVGGPGAYGPDPVPNRCGDELGAVARQEPGAA